MDDIIIGPEQLAAVFDAHAGALKLYAAQFSGTPADVVQEAFLDLVRQTTRPDCTVAWLYRAVRNRAISGIRSAGRRRRHERSAAMLVETWFLPSEENAVDGKLATQALQSLPEDQREIVVARIWGGLSFQQFAQVAGVSSSTAHRRYQSALAALRQELGISWPKENTTT